MTTKPYLRLTKLIAEETKGPITLNRLTDMINGANRKAGTNCFINRRTLHKIKNAPEKVGLTLNVLIALNTYFKERGQGLEQLPILETRGILEILVAAPRVVFM